MTNTNKFTFDTIFDKSGEILAEPPKPQKRSYLAAEVDEIREEARTEGTRSAQAMADQAVAASLKQLSAVMESFFNVLDGEVEHVRREAAQLAFAIGAKLAGRALEDQPTQAIEEMTHAPGTNRSLVAHSRCNDCRFYRQQPDLGGNWLA